MNAKKKNSLTLKLIILLLVSAAFILARFGQVMAQTEAPPIEDKVEVAADKPATGEKAIGQFPSGDGGPSLTGPVLKLIGALIVVVIGIYGFLFVLKRMMGTRFSGNRKNKLIEIVETTHLAPKKSLSLIRYGKRAVLIGIADGSITALAEIDPEEVEQMLAGTTPTRIETGFKGAFEQARDKMRGISLKSVRTALAVKDKESAQTA